MTKVNLLEALALLCPVLFCHHITQSIDSAMTVAAMQGAHPTQYDSNADFCSASNELVYSGYKVIQHLLYLGYIWAYLIQWAVRYSVNSTVCLIFYCTYKHMCCVRVHELFVSAFVYTHGAESLLALHPFSYYAVCCNCFCTHTVWITQFNSNSVASSLYNEWDLFIRHYKWILKTFRQHQAFK